MPDRKWRVLLVSSQPVQGDAAVLRLLAAHPRLDILVAYCSLPDPRLWNHAEYLNKHVFDEPQADSYPWTYVANRSPRPSLASFFGLFNPGLAGLVPRVDCCVVYGYAYASFWVAIASAKLSRTALLLTTDAIYLDSWNGKAWKVSLKKRLLPAILRLADGILVPSTPGRQFLRSLGIPEERITLTPYVVDNATISAAAGRTNRGVVRRGWGVPEDASVVLVCAKLIPRKRPHDVLRAFAAAGVPNSYLVFVGEGPLTDALRAEARALGIIDQVRFLGWVRYTDLPRVYASCDLLVAASEHEPWGLPVNEALVCGTPVVASHRVGAAYDLLAQGKTGFVYPCGNVQALADILRQALADRERLRAMGRAGRERMETWSPRENVEALAQAVEKVTQLKSPSPRG